MRKLYFGFVFLFVFCSNIFASSFDAKSLYESADLHQQEKGRRVLRSIVHKDSIGYEQLDAAKLLFKGHTQEDKEIGKGRLLSCLTNNNMVAVGAAKFLFKNADNEETKDIARRTLFSVLKNPENYYRAPAEDVYTDQLRVKIETAILLLQKGNDQDKQKGVAAIQDAKDHAFFSLRGEKRFWSLAIIAGNLERNNVEQEIIFNIRRYFLTCGDRNYESSARNELLEMAKNSKHPYQYMAAKLLYDKSLLDKHIAEEIIRSISKQKDHPNQEEAKEKLSLCA